MRRLNGGNVVSRDTAGYRRVLVVQAGSLIATAWLVWKLALVLRLHHHTLANTLVRGVACPVIAWVWAAAITFALYYAVPEVERAGRQGVTLRTATTAVWFGPAMILLSEFSPAALLAALVLVVQTSRLLYAQWQAGAPRSGNGPVRRAPYQPGTFAGCELPPGVVWCERGPALAAAVTLQGGVAAAALNLPLLGTGLLCLGTALLTVYSMAAGVASVGRPLRLPHSIATVLMAVVLTLAGALGYGGGGLGMSGDQFVSGPPGFLDIVRTLMSLLFYENSFAAPPNTARLPVPREAPNAGANGGFPGVILWPEVSSVVKLVAPIPPGGGLFNGPHPQPLSIPFSGGREGDGRIFQARGIDSHKSPVSVLPDEGARWQGHGRRIEQSRHYSHARPRDAANGRTQCKNRRCLTNDAVPARRER